MSNIGDFYALLGAMTVSFTDASGTAHALTAYYGSTLKNSVQASGTPCRLLLPYSDRDEMSATVEEFQIGNVAPVTWTIIDQLLWRPAAQGQGLEDSAADLREYMSAYITAVMAFDASSISDRMDTRSVGIVLRDDIFFPSGAVSNQYIGADVIWTVVEDDPLPEDVAL